MLRKCHEKRLKRKSVTDEATPRKQLKISNNSSSLKPLINNNPEATISEMANQFNSLSFKKAFLKKIEIEEKYVFGMLNINYMFSNWMISLGAITLRRTCKKCGARMKIGKAIKGNEFWYCSSRNSKFCKRGFRMDEKFCFRFDIAMKDLIECMFLWYSGIESSEIIEIGITPEEYHKLNNVLTEVCVVKCISSSRKIGGLRAKVNLEIGKRGGVRDANNIAICGVLADDHTQYFFNVLTDEYPFYLEMKECLKEWLRPGTIVCTNSKEYETIKEMKWIIKEDWSLVRHSDCIARDLWVHINQHLPIAFNHFVLDVLEYSNPSKQ